MTSKTTRHKLSDWLALHELDPTLCRQVLRAAVKEVGSQSTDQVELAVGADAQSPDAAWRAVVDAMCAFFPSQQGVIEETFRGISKIISNNDDRGGRALTLDHGDLSYPTIIYKYAGSVSDALVIAHEFGHALQIVLSEKKFVSPIVREVCAFASEAILLKRLQETDRARHERFAQVWRSYSRKYLLSDGHILKVALNDPDASYKYGWNYPIARYLAEHVSREFTPEPVSYTHLTLPTNREV